MKKFLLLSLCVGFLFAGCSLEDLFGPESSDSSSSSSNNSNNSGSNATTGTLQISADSKAKLYVNGSYKGQGSAYLTLSPGSYTVEAYAPSSGSRCWTTKTTVYAGKNSVVKNNAYCQ